MAQASPSQLHPPPSGRSEVVGCGYQSKTRGSGCADRDLQAYALVYLLDGGGHFRDETTPERRVAAGDCLVLFPGKLHSYLNRDQPNWTEIWLVFRGGIFSQLENDGVLDRSRPVLRPGLDQGLIDAFDAIHERSMRADWREAHELVAQAHALCTAVERLDLAAAPQADTVARACTLLSDSLHLALDLRQVAAALGMGYEAFRKFFAAATGVPPARWRSLKRIEQARSMLRHETTSLAAIAERLGYCDEYFFNRQFTRVTGISPARFRRDFARAPTGPLPAPAAGAVR